MLAFESFDLIDLSFLSTETLGDCGVKSELFEVCPIGLLDRPYKKIFE
jgi:hypothetical protein